MGLLTCPLAHSIAPAPRRPDATEVDPLASLTERQRAVLRHAFDVARATLTQHLRTAERKLLTALLADGRRESRRRVRARERGRAMERNGQDRRRWDYTRSRR